jgi:uncharacterized protein YacL
MSMVKVCGKCGRDNEVGAIFCVYCGNQFSKVLGTELATSNTELPCLIRVVGSFFGCLIGLIIGLILSLICILPIAAVFGSIVNSDSYLNIAIILIIILALATTILGISKGPTYFWKILTSIVDTFRALTSPH